MTILYAGIDLAKNVFALHGVNAGGAVVLRQPKARSRQAARARRCAAAVHHRHRGLLGCPPLGPSL